MFFQPVSAETAEKFWRKTAKSIKGLDLSHSNFVAHVASGSAKRLLREFADLGFEEHTVDIAGVDGTILCDGKYGIRMHVFGKSLVFILLGKNLYDKMPAQKRLDKLLGVEGVRSNCNTAIYYIAAKDLKSVLGALDKAGLDVNRIKKDLVQNHMTVVGIPSDATELTLSRVGKKDTVLGFLQWK